MNFKNIIFFILKNSCCTDAEVVGVKEGGVERDVQYSYYSCVSMFSVSCIFFLTSSYASLTTMIMWTISL